MQSVLNQAPLPVQKVEEVIIRAGSGKYDHLLNVQAIATLYFKSLSDIMPSNMERLSNLLKGVNIDQVVCYNTSVAEDTVNFLQNLDTLSYKFQLSSFRDRDFLLHTPFLPMKDSITIIFENCSITEDRLDCYKEELKLAGYEAKELQII